MWTPSGILVRLGPQGDLGHDLVGERAGHDERRMARGTAQVDQPALGQDQERSAVGKGVAIDLRLDLDLLDLLLAS